jgi:hypothetical protein
MRLISVLVLLLFVACTHEPVEVIPGPCATMNNIKYASDIKPIIQQNCVGCHSDYIFYDSLNAVINSGAFYKRVLQIRNMPPSGPMDTCDYIILKRWIYNGHSN